MPFYSKWLDRFVRREGYITVSESEAQVKAAQMEAGREALFAGEVELGSGGASSLLTIDWSDEQLKRLALQSAWVFSNASVIANEFSQGEMEVVEWRGEDKPRPLHNHQFEQLLETPSSLEFMDASFLWGYTALWAVLRGEAYWLVSPNKPRDQVAEVLPIPADRCWPEPDAKKYIKYFNYLPVSGGDPIPLPNERVLYWRRPNLLNYHRGFPLFTPLSIALKTDQAAKEWNLSTFENGLALQTILSLPSDLAEPLFQRAKEDIKQALVAEQQRFMIVRAGHFNAQAVGLNHRDAEYLALREMNRKEIDRVMGIPEGFWSEKANRANALAARAALIDLTIWPLMVSFQRAVSAQLIRRYYGPNLRARFKEISPVDRDLLLRERNTYWRAYKLDEVREELGKPKIGGELGETLFLLAISGKVGAPGGSPLGGAPGASPAAGKNNPVDKPGGQAATLDEGVESVGEKVVQAAGKNGAGPDLAASLPGLEGGGEALPAGGELKAHSSYHPDLLAWQETALINLRQGGHPAEAGSIPDSPIPAWIKSDILVTLWSARTEAEIKAAFADHLEAPPPEPIKFVGQDEELPILTNDEGLSDEDLKAAALDYDEVMPEVTGLLSAVQLKKEVKEDEPNN
ncbi:MAG: phage portal protein [Anaerolineae bacterium]|nr:phage portal protein [Anaerolineae bacterium]